MRIRADNFNQSNVQILKVVGKETRLIWDFNCVVVNP